MTTTPPPATPAYAPASVAPTTNILAIIALIAAFIVPLGGIIMGHISLRQIKRTGERGHGLALAGTIVGYVLTVAYLVLAFLYLAVFALLASQRNY